MIAWRTRAIRRAPGVQRAVIARRTRAVQRTWAARRAKVVDRAGVAQLSLAIRRTVGTRPSVAVGRTAAFRRAVTGKRAMATWRSLAIGRVHGRTVAAGRTYSRLGRVVARPISLRRRVADQRTVGARSAVTLLLRVTHRRAVARRRSVSCQAGSGPGRTRNSGARRSGADWCRSNFCPAGGDEPERDHQR